MHRCTAMNLQRKYFLKLTPAILPMFLHCAHNEDEASPNPRSYIDHSLDVYNYMYCQFGIAT